MKDINKDLKEKLKKIAKDENALLMSFIAPDTLVRKSPVAFDYATISTQDLYRVESVIENHQEKGCLPKKLHLIIQTPGGAVDASIKIAKYLQNSFDEIIAYVPYEAASGGTVLCLSANKIVMGLTSNLTPIDPQIRYKNQWVSATSYKQAVISFQEEYGKLRPEEIPSPHQQIGEKFDPVILKEMDKLVLDTLETAHKLLIKSQKATTSEAQDKLIPIVVQLGRTNYPHSHVITLDEAKELGLNIDDNAATLKLLKTYKRWVSCRLSEEETNHIVDDFCPGENHEKTVTETSIQSK